MSRKFFRKASFHEALFVLDTELACECQHSGCWFCSSRLHVSNYPRKPRGAPASFQDYYGQRLSFTCAKCYRRCTPPSVRFFGRIRSVVGIAILIAALTCGPSERRCRQLARCFGVRLSVSTWQRWRKWWRERFQATGFWRQAKGSFAEPVDLGRLPAGLLHAFPGWIDVRLLATLRFLSPLTGGALRAV